MHVLLAMYGIMMQYTNTCIHTSFDKTFKFKFGIFYFHSIWTFTRTWIFSIEPLKSTLSQWMCYRIIIKQVRIYLNVHQQIFLLSNIHIIYRNGHLLNLIIFLEKDKIYHFSLHVNHNYELYLNLTALCVAVANQTALWCYCSQSNSL